MVALSIVHSVFVVFLALLVSPLSCLYVPESQEPVMVQGKGTIWPKPQKMTDFKVAFTLSKSSFQFTYGSSSSKCDVIGEAFQRYHKLIFPHAPSKKAFRGPRKAKTLTKMTGLQVRVEQPCQGAYPNLDSDESYTLTVDGPTGMLSAGTVWGALRGLETFSQLVSEAEDGTYLIHKITVQDFPRFPHRGILLDTSRHFVPVKVLKEMLDAMACNKLNVFHWHIVDDPSFPYQSKVFPDLSAKRAFNQGYTNLYSQEDIKEIIQYARMRGIRVIPEFDTPGHTSWDGLPVFLQKILEIRTSVRKDYIVWQEVVDSGVQVAKDTVVEVFEDNYAKEMASVTSKGLPAILASRWSLNAISDGSDWQNYYKCDPQDFKGTQAQKALVMGGEAWMWGEFVDSTNLMTTIWPRASAVAERLWSAKGVTDLADAGVRLWEHRCRMTRRGIPAEPMDHPGFCQHELIGSSDGLLLH